jgi:hypothetical protein
MPTKNQGTRLLATKVAKRVKREVRVKELRYKISLCRLLQAPITQPDPSVRTVRFRGWIQTLMNLSLHQVKNVEQERTEKIWVDGTGAIWSDSWNVKRLDPGRFLNNLTIQTLLRHAVTSIINN